MPIYVLRYFDTIGSDTLGVYDDLKKATIAGHLEAARRIEEELGKHQWDSEISLDEWQINTQASREIKLWNCFEDVPTEYLLTPEQLFDDYIVDFEPWPTIQQRRAFFDDRDKRREQYRKFYDARMNKI